MPRSCACVFRLPEVADSTLLPHSPLLPTAVLAALAALGAARTFSGLASSLSCMFSSCAGLLSRGYPPAVAWETAHSGQVLWTLSLKTFAHCRWLGLRVQLERGPYEREGTPWRLPPVLRSRWPCWWASCVSDFPPWTL